MYLSKSKYCRLWQCEKQFWLDANHPELQTKDSSSEGRMITGIEVGQLAMGLFGDYTKVTVLNEDGRPDIPAMIEKTKTCLDAGIKNICEAAFSYEGLYCAVDILRKQKKGYAIYEVKSSTKETEIYGVDIAYQKYVLEHCGVKVTGTYLVCIEAGRKILCKRFSTRSRMALESRADSGLNSLFFESHGGQNGMRAGTA